METAFDIISLVLFIVVILIVLCSTIYVPLANLLHG